MKKVSILLIGGLLLAVFIYSSDLKVFDEADNEEKAKSEIMLLQKEIIDTINRHDHELFYYDMELKHLKDSIPEEELESGLEEAVVSANLIEASLKEISYGESLLPYQQELDQALKAFITAFAVIDEQLTIDKSILDTGFMDNFQAGNEAFNEVLSQLGLNEANMAGEIMG